MPPKKNTIKTPSKPKNTPTKITKRKIIKEKPKLKTPSVVKVKIPCMSTRGQNVNAVSPINGAPEKFSRTKISLQRKVELANEVLQETFLKKKTLEPAVPNKEQETVTEVKVVKRRGRVKNTGNTTDIVKTADVRPEDTGNTTDKVNTADVSNSTPSQETKSEEALENKPKRRRGRTVKIIEKDREIQTEIPDPTTVEVNGVKKSMKQTKLTDLKTGITRLSNLEHTTTKGPNIRQLHAKPRIIRKAAGRGKKNIVNEAPIIEQHPKENTCNTAKDNFAVNLERPKTQPSRKSAEVINSRKTSMSSTSDCLSWTKDISSSSTITCLTVCSTDFVCLDNKLPMLKLAHVDYPAYKKEKKKNYDKSSSSSSSSSSDSESSDESSKHTSSGDIVDVDIHSLNLSTSSISQANPPQDMDLTNKTKSVSKISRVLDKLTSNLNKIDLELLNWIGYQNEDLNVDAKKSQERMFRILKEENDVISHCQQIKLILTENAGKENTLNVPKATEVPTDNESNFLKPSNISFTKTTNLKSNQHTTGIDKIADSNKEVSPIENKNRDDDDNNFTTDDVPYIPFDHSYDDDDALSLFAESITGIESSRRNSSVGSPPHKNVTDHEEYVPEPVTKECVASEKLIYNPTKIIVSDNSVQNVKARTICEKQNADSTSLYREPEQDVASKLSSAGLQSDASLVNKTFSPNIIPISRAGSCLMSSIYKPLFGLKSVVFKGICFFYLIRSCRHNEHCRFPHVKPDPRDINNMLHTLSEEMFIQEYMMMRNWPGLRRLYGLCYVEECARRELTSFLVEMALDFITKANTAFREDMKLKVEVVEFTLLYLNSVDLDTCENLLKHNVNQDTVLCDEFMQIIAVTQNFSRFKSVFLKLTVFIIKNNRSFSLNVANQILERVCILPYEESLAQALVDIIKHTDQAIFENSMMAKFEQQLLSLNKPLYDQLIEFRREKVNRAVLANLYVTSPRLMHEIETVPYMEREKRYTSPDTTHLDNLNKTAEEPVIKRTINFDPSRSFSINAQYSTSSSSNDSAEEVRPKHGIRSWRDNNMFNKISTFTPPIRPHLPPNKRPMHRQVSYGGSSSKFPRRPGTDYF